MNKNLHIFPTKQVSTMTPSERRDLRLLLALPDSITNLKKSIEDSLGAEKARLEEKLRQNLEDYDRLKNLYGV